MSNPVYLPVVERRSSRHSLRGVDYHVSEWGDSRNPLLVLLHGWGDTGTTFQFLVDALQKGWFVIAPDWRGFGDSGFNAQSYWFPDYIADLSALLDIYSPGDPVRLLGHSMGGNIGGLYAGIFPERVESFVNVEGFGLAQRNAQDAPENYRKWIEMGRRIQAYGRFDTLDDLAARILKRSPRMPPERALFVARQWGKQDVDGSTVIKADPAHKLPNAVLYRREEAHACWRLVTAPVLAVSGAESEFSSGAHPQIEGDAGSLPFPKLTLETIADSGHMIHFEQPALLALAVENFLGS